MQCEKIVLDLYCKGIHAGIRDIFSFVRVKRWMYSTDDVGFKVNNNYSKMVAKELEAKHPELKKYFKHRNRYKELKQMELDYAEA